MNEQGKKIVLWLEENGFCEALDGWFEKRVANGGEEVANVRRLAFLVEDRGLRFRVRSGERSTDEVYYAVRVGSEIEVVGCLRCRLLREVVEERSKEVEGGGWDWKLLPV